MIRRFIFLFSLIIILSSCKKVNDSPQWEIEVIGPLFKASMGLDKLIGDSNIIADANGAQILDFEDTFSNFTIDSIYQIPDTTITTIVTAPFPFPSVVNGTQFYQVNNNIALGVTGVQLKEAIISSGKIRLEIKNTLHSKVNFTYTIPKAIKNGLPFKVIASVDSASPTNPKYLSGEYDFSGYDIDLTGANGNLFNTLSYEVKAVSDNPGYTFAINSGDTMVNLNSTLVSIQPYFVRGYLGQAGTHEVNKKDLLIGSLIKNGLIKLDSVTLNLDILNYIGAEEQGYISQFRSINSRTGTNIDLVAPSFVQHYLNINRASLSGNANDPVNPTTYSIELNNQNSNLKALLENTPDTIDFDIQFNLNPLGNISGNDDFVYRDRLVNTHLKINLPLRFAMNQLILVDTVPFNVANPSSFDQIGPLTLTLIADNGFPFDLNVQFFMLDSTSAIVDSVFTPDLIKAAPYDANYRATGIQQTKINIIIDPERKHRFLSVQNVGIRMQFNTPDFPQLIQMYSDYRLDFKLTGDGTYSIR